MFLATITEVIPETYTPENLSLCGAGDGIRKLHSGRLKHHKSFIWPQPIKTFSGIPHIKTRQYWPGLFIQEPHGAWWQDLSGLNSNQIKISRGWQGHCHNLSTVSSLILRLYSFKQSKAKIATKQKSYQWLISSQISLWWNWGDVLERSSCSQHTCVERDF